MSRSSLVTRSVIAILSTAFLFTQSAFSQFSRIEGDLGVMQKPEIDSIGLINYKVYYRTLIAQDGKAPDIKDEGITVLLLGDNGSVFKDYIQYRRYSLFWDAAKWKQPATGTMNLALTFGRSIIDYTVAVVYKEKKYIFKPELGVSLNVRYEEPLPAFPWVITKERKRIGAYPCTKATLYFSGREWEAWFTEELPISSGPYIFGGLPGLILEMRDKDKEYCISFEGMEKAGEDDTPLSIGRSRREKTLPREKVRTMMRNFLSAPMSAIGDRIKLKEGEKPKNFSLPYNPLELE